jgi:hypothetical protein
VRVGLAPPSGSVSTQAFAQPMNPQHVGPIATMSTVASAANAEGTRLVTAPTPAALLEE